MISFASMRYLGLMLLSCTLKKSSMDLILKWGVTKTYYSHFLSSYYFSQKSTNKNFVQWSLISFASIRYLGLMLKGKCTPKKSSNGLGYQMRRYQNVPILLTTNYISYIYELVFLVLQVRTRHSLTCNRLTCHFRQKNKYSWKCLELPNLARNSIKFFFRKWQVRLVTFITRHSLSCHTRNSD